MPSRRSTIRPLALLLVTRAALAAPGDPPPAPEAPPEELDLELEAEPAPAPAPAPVAPPPPPAAPPPPPIPPADEPDVKAWSLFRDVVVSGYVQSQVGFNQLSEDEVSPDGDPLNFDRFLVRRGRIRVTRAFEYGLVDLEVDANTVNGIAVTARTAEATVLYPNRSRPEAPPLVSLAMGLGDIPFGWELFESNRDRLFLERSTGSRALFIGNPDVGARLAGGLGPVRYAVAVQNGVPVPDGPQADIQVYQARKTFVGRLGFDVGGPDTHRARAGVSLLDGQGLHRGTPATKSQLLWSDANQDGLVTLDELGAVNGQAASPSETFHQWAVNADAGAEIDLPFGRTEVFAEATLATNLDRGLFVADPVSTGYDLRELAWVAGATQELFERALVGFRADFYDPSADAFENRRGEFVPADLSILTLSPIVGVGVRDLGRVVVQYDYVADHLGRDARGAPVDVPNDTWTVRAQMEF